MKLIWRSKATGWRDKKEMVIVHLLHIADALVYLLSFTLLSSAMAPWFIFRDGE